MNRHNFEIDTLFSERELFALKAFYSGTRARQIRPLYGDPWLVLSKHRHLRKELYEAVKWRLVSINLPPPPTVPRIQRESPRWQFCPHCEQWIERDDWRPGRSADAWLGHRSGCWSCFDARVARYQQTRE